MLRDNHHVSIKKTQASQRYMHVKQTKLLKQLLQLHPNKRKALLLARLHTVVSACWQLPLWSWFYAYLRDHHIWNLLWKCLILWYKYLDIQNCAELILRNELDTHKFPINSRVYTVFNQLTTSKESIFKHTVQQRRNHWTVDD